MTARLGLLVATGLVFAAACGGDTTIEGQGGAGGTSSGTSPGGGGNGGSAVCADLEADYATALSAARSCAPPLSVEQCTELVFTELDCPCTEIFVNPDNASAVTELASIRDAYTMAGCGSEACPAIACEAPTMGTCEPDGMDAGSGSCISM